MEYIFKEELVINCVVTEETRFDLEQINKKKPQLNLVEQAIFEKLYGAFLKRGVCLDLEFPTKLYIRFWKDKNEEKEEYYDYFLGVGRAVLHEGDVEEYLGDMLFRKTAKAPEGKPRFKLQVVK